MSAAAPEASHAGDSFIDSDAIRTELARARGAEPAAIREVLAKARSLVGLDPAEAALLLTNEEPQLVGEMLAAAHEVKEAIYGRRVVLFAPLYFGNACVNSCLYCGFRREIVRPRRRLSLSEVAAETRLLLGQGHKRLLVIGGEESGASSLEHLLAVIETIYATRPMGPSGAEGGVRGDPQARIRRVNVETAPLSVEGFRRLAQARIGTYVLFQETYDRESYRRMHPRGPKADYDNRLSAMDRAMEGGIEDVGIGALFGLHDPREEVLSLLLHARHLEERFGVGPHTISVPRIEPAEGAPASQDPPHAVSDLELKKLVAILRLAVPYTGIILSTREPAALRRELLDLGVSQMSAGSSTEPGGYAAREVARGAIGNAVESPCQFAVADLRSLDEVIADIARHGYLPSFCTGCYRRGRTGSDFMALAKPGLIRRHCLPNALLTYREYLLDYASPSTRELGERVIREQLETEIPVRRLPKVLDALAQLESGQRDIYL